MLHRRTIVCVLVLSLLVFPSLVLSKADFVSLFNGKDLTGWKVVGAGDWRAVDGELRGPGAGGGWLRSEAKYRDFVLRLEYRIEPGGNSGIFLRATDEGDPAFTGMEVQILDDYGKPPKKTGSGSIYAAVAPRVNASNPAGEWNRAQIACIGNMVTVWLNGRRIVRADLTDPKMNAEITRGPTFDKRAQTGYVGLQNYGVPVTFRNIELRKV